MPLVFLLLFFTEAEAQTIVVEATRLEADAAEASRSITTIDEALIAMKRPATVADVLREIPGVEVVRQGHVGQTTSVFVRGARSEDTLVLIDGIEVNDAISPGRGFDFSSLSPAGIAKIEVFRGPQSVRFGAGALGGVIAITTKEGRGRLRTHYSLEGGAYETARGAVLSAGNSGALGYTLGVETLRTAGFSAAKSASGAGEKDGAETKSAFTKLTWQRGTAQTLGATFRYSSAAVDLDRMGGPDGDDPNNTSRAGLLLAGLTASDRFFSERLQSRLGVFYSQMQRSNRNEPDAVSSNDSADSFSSQNTKLDSNHEWLVGEAHSLRLDLQWREETGVSASTFNGAASGVPAQSQAVVGEALTYLYDDEVWFADTGVRSDQHSSAGSVPSYRVSAGRHFFSKRWKLSATYGTGFKPPSLYQLFSNYGNRALMHEKSEAVDLALAGELSGGGSVSISYFRNSFRDMIDYDLLAEKYFNVAKARSEGLALQAVVPLRRDLALEAQYTYSEVADEATGLPLLRRPRNKWSAAARYKAHGIEGFAQYRFRGERADVNPASFQRMQADAYATVDVGGSYAFSPAFKFSGRIENLFDQTYEEVAGYGTPGLSVYVGVSGEI